MTPGAGGAGAELSVAAQHAVFAKDRRAVMSDGTPIAYTVVGTGGRTPIVFLNGWTCSDAYWAGVVPPLVAAGHRAVLMDTRGHGESGLPRPAGRCGRGLTGEDVSVRRIAADILEVLDDARLPRAALAGFSMGVQCLFEAYDLAPDRVAALVPVAGTYENPVRSFADVPGLDRLFPIADVLFRRIPFELLSPIIRRTTSPALGHRVVRAIRVAGPKVTAEALAPHMHQIGEVNFSVLWRMMSGMRAHSAAAVLPNVKVPTLVLAGRGDVFTPPRVQQRMAALIPGSEARWWDDAGHMLPLEEPAEVAEAIREFLARRVDGTGAPADGSRKRRGGAPARAAVKRRPAP